MFKKILVVFFVSTILFCGFSVCSYAAASTSEETVYVDESNQQRTSGLILTNTIAVSKSGTTLTITGITECINDVKKCGFKTVTVERRATTSSEWEEVEEFTKLYDETFVYNLEETVSVSSGYQYRVVCEHYAYKGFLQWETKDNVSNIVS